VAERSRLVVITGMSGAGRTQAANFLEDHGFDVIDNLPAALIEEIVDHVELERREIAGLALAIDTRRGLSFHALDDALAAVRADGVKTMVLFVDADDQTLMRRYSEHRRPHPVERPSLAESIAAERVALDELKASADIIIDTSELSLPDFTERMRQAFSESLPARPMRVVVESFGFKYGLPRNLDLVLDTRFLPNPHWEEELRPQTGRDPAVRDFVLSQPDAKEFLDRVTSLLAFLIPRYTAEGKAYLTIGVGCTGGRHRSVAIAEQLARRLGEEDVDAAIRHRDIDR
jgi:UPF0042 nucleotide-binding protein